MLVEFEDASCASNVATRGRRINDNPELQSVTVSIDLYTPDLAEQYQSQRMYPPATPTRRSVQQSDIFGAFTNLSLHSSIHSPGSIGTASASMLSTASSMPYMASSSGYAMPNSLPFVMGGPGSVYVPTAANPYQQAYTPGINPQNNSGPGESAFHSFTTRSYPQGGFPLPGYGSSNDLPQSQFGNEFGYYNQRPQGLARDLGQYSSPTNRRPYTPRTTRGRQHSSPANSHHNHVDIAKIRQGIDVRTTVSTSINLFSNQ
jgi:hypothetical protein